MRVNNQAVFRDGVDAALAISLLLFEDEDEEEKEEVAGDYISSTQTGSIVEGGLGVIL